MCFSLKKSEEDFFGELSSGFLLFRVCLINGSFKSRFWLRSASAIVAVVAFSQQRQEERANYVSLRLIFEMNGKKKPLSSSSAKGSQNDVQSPNEEKKIFIVDLRENIALCVPKRFHLISLWAESEWVNETTSDDDDVEGPKAFFTRIWCAVKRASSYHQFSSPNEPTRLLLSALLIFAREGKEKGGKMCNRRKSTCVAYLRYVYPEKLKPHPKWKMQKKFSTRVPKTIKLSICRIDRSRFLLFFRRIIHVLRLASSKPNKNLDYAEIFHQMDFYPLESSFLSFCVTLEFEFDLDISSEAAELKERNA